MSYFLKRTKKSCLKFLQKMAPSKQLFTNRLEEDEISSNNIEGAKTFKSTPKEKFEDLPDQIFNYEGVIKIDKNYSVQDFENELDAEFKLQQCDYDDETHNNNKNTVLHSLTSRLFLTADGYEFRRLQQLRSDTASEVIPFEPERDTVSDIVFEKVNFKKHVRYLQHTPSNSSLDNFSTNSISSNPECLFKAKAMTPDDAVTNDYSQIIKYGLQTQTAHTPSIHFLPFNVGIGSRSNRNYQNVVISEERDCYNKLTPAVRWDINGNSLDDDFFINDNWDEFDNLRNHLYGNSNPHMESDDSQISSRYSSSTTLETWLEEEFLE